MDIELLSKMVRELVPEHHEVGLPGLGTFVSEFVPASFSDRGYTINPPYRRVSFIPGTVTDNSLVSLYAQSNGIEEEQARALLQHFLEETKKLLTDRKVVVFPGLGRLRATKQNNIFFITDETLDIYPEGFGLAPVSLKNHEETPSEVHHVVSSLADILVEPADVPAEPAPAPAPALTPAPAPESAPALSEPKSVEDGPAETPVTPGKTEDGAVSEANDEGEQIPEGVVSEAPATLSNTEDGAISEANDDGEQISEGVASETPATLGKAEEGAVSEANDDAEQIPEGVPSETCATLGTIRGGTVAEGDGGVERSETVSEGTPSGTELESATEPATKPKPKRRKVSRWVWLGPLLALAILALAAGVFMVLLQVAPDFIDTILYTPEELQIINY